MIYQHSLLLDRCLSLQVPIRQVPIRTAPLELHGISKKKKHVTNSAPHSTAQQRSRKTIEATVECSMFSVPSFACVYLMCVI